MYAPGVTPPITGLVAPHGGPTSFPEVAQALREDAEPAPSTAERAA